MSGAKERWMEEVERVGEEFCGGIIDREEAEARMRKLGFDPQEIKAMLDEALA